MTSRSIVLGTAALLLMSGATPLPIGFSPTAAFAQQLTLDAAMAGKPSELNAKQLSERIQVLRAAIDDGTLTGSSRQAAQKKLKAYREVLDAIRAGRQEATQERQAEQPRQGERTQRQQQPGRNAEQQQAERQAERQAQRQAERQAQRQAERQAQRQAEGQAERQAARQAEQQAERQAARQAERQAARQAERQGERQEERQAARQEERQAERQNVDSRARTNIADRRSAADLDIQTLRQRLNENRQLLGTDRLSGADRQELHRQLVEDREELRARVASSQEEEREARGSDDRRRGSGDRNRPSGDRMNDRDVSRIIEERRPSDQLTERELEQRVRVLSRALDRGNISVREAEVARLLVDRDRDELRGRLYADRDRRRDRRRGGSRDDVFVEFEAGYRPPPVIYAAEAMPGDIQMQLVAPPRYQTQRAYSSQEIATNHDVREAMPGIEIDTLNFDFGSAEVRPEEIEKLDEIGVVIENIVAERPDEVFLIEGHTDAVGSDPANDALSQQRAQAVVEALLDYFIIDPENLQTVGLGERYLKIQSPGPEEENRRVTVRRITPLLAGRG